MTVVNELQSVGTFLAASVPSATVKYEVPAKPTPSDLVVRAQSNDYKSETRYHYRIDRTYQVIAFGADSPTVLAKMDAISRKVMDKRMAIPINGSTRFIRVGSFSFSAPFRNENGQWAAIGVLETEVREARTQEEYGKIWHVYGRYEFRVPVNNENE